MAANTKVALLEQGLRHLQSDLEKVAKVVEATAQELAVRSQAVRKLDELEKDLKQFKTRLLIGLAALFALAAKNPEVALELIKRGFGS